MKDFESRLRDLMHERGDNARTSPNAPPGVLRRVRRRQAGTVLVSAVTAAVVVAGAVAGAAVFGKSHRNGHPASFSEPTRTVTLDGVRMTYPYDWALQQVTRGAATPSGSPLPPVKAQESSSNAAGVADQSPPPGVTGPTGPTTTGPTTTGPAPTGFSSNPLGPTTWLQLANYLPDDLAQVGCPDGCAPTTAVILQLEPRSGGGGVSWPASLPTMTSPGTGWQSAETEFTVHDITYHATVFFGPEASQADRDALVASYDSLGFPSSEHGVVGGAGIAGSNGSQQVSTVVAGGTTDSGDDWVMQTDANGSLMLQVGNASAGFGVASAWDSQGPAPTPKLLELVTTVGDDTVAVFGSVTSDAARIEIRPDSRSPIDVPVLAEPGVLGSDRAYFFTEAARLEKGSIVALAPDGSVIASHAFDTGPGSSPGSPPAVCSTPSPDQGGSASGSCTDSGRPELVPPLGNSLPELCPNSTAAGSCIGASKGPPTQG
jgi:hypothetical protein